MASPHALRGELVAIILLAGLGFALVQWRSPTRTGLGKPEVLPYRPPSGPQPFRSTRTNGRTLIVNNEPVALVRHYSKFGSNEEASGRPPRPGEMVVLVDDQVGPEEGANDVVLASDRHALWSYHSSPGLARLQEMATHRRLFCTPRGTRARVVSVLEGALAGEMKAVEVELGDDGERAWVADIFVR